jgi:predicted RNA-binding protein YlqC (UPF0109 family)
MDHQDEVHITVTTTEAGTTFKVTVALADVGKVNRQERADRKGS